MSGNYQALYRKWRPMTFGETVGQEHVSDTLKNSIASDRIAHAYLFCGTRGTGKTSTAKIFSRAVNCEHPIDGEPCNECPTCKGILDGSILDVYEMDAASNRGVDDIRVIRDEVLYTPAGCTYKVYIIDEVHMLTDIAFNALLKTLEEPPRHAIFILATTEPHKLPATILSRCQRFDFRRIGVDAIAKRMTKIAEAEGIHATPDALELVAELGDGSMRDALSILDQCAAYGLAELRTENVVDIVGIVDKQVLFDLAGSILNQDTKTALIAADSFLAMGKETLNFFEDFITHFRNLLICKSTDDPAELLETTAESAAKYKAQAELCSVEQILYFIKTLSEQFTQAKYMSNPQIAVEMAIVKLCAPQYSSDAEALLSRIERLERALVSGASAQPQSHAQAQPAPAAETQPPASSPAPAVQTPAPSASAASEQPPWSVPEPPKPEPVQEQPVPQTVDTAVPQPAAQPVSRPASGTDGKWELWAEALNEIKKESKSLYMFMYSASAYDRDEIIEVELETEMAYQKIATPNGLEYLSSLFSKVSGGPKRAQAVLKGKKKAEPEREQPSIMDLAKKKDLLGDKMNIIQHNNH